MTMSPDRGGIFDVLLGLVRRGLGGTGGDGRQYVSWIHDARLRPRGRLADRRDDLAGPVNLASPNPLPNAEFMRDASRGVGHPLGLPAQRWMLEIGRGLHADGDGAGPQEPPRRAGPAAGVGVHSSSSRTWPEAAVDLCLGWWRECASGVPCVREVPEARRETLGRTDAGDGELGNPAQVLGEDRVFRLNCSRHPCDNLAPLQGGFTSRRCLARWRCPGSPRERRGPIMSNCATRKRYGDRKRYGNLVARLGPRRASRVEVAAGLVAADVRPRRRRVPRQHLTTGDQTAASVAMDADGDFVVAWQSRATRTAAATASTPSGTTPPAQAQGAEFRVNTYHRRRPAHARRWRWTPTATSSSPGTSYGQDGSGVGVYAQRYNAAGVAQGDRVPRQHRPPPATSAAPSVAMDADGDFVVAWAEQRPGRQRLRRLRPAVQRRRRARRATEFRVNTTTAGSQSVPSVAMDADGDFVVAWQSTGQDGDVVRRLRPAVQRRAARRRAAEFRVNTTTAGDQSSPSVAMDADGDFVVAWQSVPQDGSGYGVYARRYNAAGTAQGGEFRVNTTTAGSQTGPAVAADADGDFVVAWDSDGQDGSGYGVYAQRYNRRRRRAGRRVPRQHHDRQQPGRPRWRWTPTGTSSSPGGATARTAAYP